MISISFNRREFASSATVKNKLKRENSNLCHCNQNVPTLFSYLVFALTVKSICLFLFLFIFPILLFNTFFLFIALIQFITSRTLHTCATSMHYTNLLIVRSREPYIVYLHTLLSLLFPNLFY